MLNKLAMLPIKLAKSAQSHPDILPYNLKGVPPPKKKRNPQLPLS